MLFALGSVALQGIRQARVALPVVAGAGIVYVFSLWDEVNQIHLLAWIGLNILLSFVRSATCNRIEKTFAGITTAGLYKNEWVLYLTALSSTTALGSGFWWVCLGSSDRVILAVTILCCIYAVGTTVNSATHARGMPLLLISNLGQAIVFFCLFRSPADFEMAVALMALMFVLVQFCRHISTLFAETIRIRDENAEKNRKLEEQKTQIQQSLAAARTANDDKNRFLAAASHDLRQPLHAMILFIARLKHLVSSDTAVELVNKIEEATQILHSQFNSLLDLSKFDAGVMHTNINSFRLDRLIQKVADGVKLDAESKKLSVSLSLIPVVIRSDSLLMERLLTNLIVNAVKFTEVGCLEIVTRVERGCVSIDIRDTGQGIAAEDLDKIFQDYYQTHNKARSKGKGTGLGLSIVKRIASLLALEIRVSSVLGKGSTFSVTIPPGQFVQMVAAPAIDDAGVSGEEAALPYSEMNLRQARVLLVDDDKSILDALAGVIADWGGESFKAAHFDEVKMLLENEGAFDVAILDDMLAEETTGLDIARFLEKTMKTKRILITTGNTNAIRLQKLRTSGFTVLIKPVVDQQLQQAISNVIGS